MATKPIDSPMASLVPGAMPCEFTDCTADCVAAAEEVVVELADVEDVEEDWDVVEVGRDVVEE